MKADRIRYAACLAAAVACHGTILLVVRAENGPKALASGEPDVAVELALVEAAPAAESTAPPANEPPLVEPIKPAEPILPEPVTAPEVPPAEPAPPVPMAREMVEPQPALKPRPAPRAATTPAPRRAPAPLGVVKAAGNSGVATAVSGANSSGSGANTKLQVRFNPRPEYPAEARRLKQAGVVLLSVEVNAQGAPTSVSITRSSGFPSLDQAAVSAVRRWRFDPSRVGGIPTSGRVDLPVRFNLQN